MALFLLNSNLYQNSSLMPTKTIRLLAVPIALWVIFSQIKCVPYCEGKNNPRFAQTNWQLIAIDNSGEKPVPATGNKASLNAFGLGIRYASVAVSFLVGFECGFEPELDVPPGVTNVLITCLQDFDASHPAGVSLNNYFKEIKYKPSTNLPLYAAISTESFNKYSNPTGEIDFVMVQPPNQPGNYQFKMKLFFGNSTKSDSIYTTPVITLY